MLGHGCCSISVGMSGCRILHHEAGILLLSARDIGLPCTSSCTGQMLHQPLGTWSDAKQVAQNISAQPKILFSAAMSFVCKLLHASLLLYQRPDYVLLSYAKAQNVMNGQLWLFQLQLHVKIRIWRCWGRRVAHCTASVSSYTKRSTSLNDPTRVAHGLKMAFPGTWYIDKADHEVEYWTWTAKD
jgi:hypothetical protein